MNNYGYHRENFRNCWLFLVLGILFTFIAVFGHYFYLNIMHRSVDTNIYNIILIAASVIPCIMSIVYGIMSIKEGEDVNKAIIVIIIVLDIAYIAVGRVLFAGAIDYIMTGTTEGFSWFYSHKHVTGGGGMTTKGGK